MTKSERAHQNKINAQKSTGPRSEAGKERARRNALKHGLTATQLILPDEKPEAIDALAQALNESMNPQNAAEDLCVQQAAVAALRMERIVAAEAAIVSDQVRHAQTQWDYEQTTRLLEAIRMLREDPAMACVKLKSFGMGVAWMLAQWKDIDNILDARGHLNNLDAIKEALRLQGFNPNALYVEGGTAFDFANHAMSSIPNFTDQQKLCDFHERSIPPMYIAMYGENSTIQADVAPGLLREWVAREIAELKELAAIYKPIDDASRREAPIRAQLLADTPQNRLMIRYLKDAESSFEKAHKTLAKLRADRAKEAEAAVALADDPAPAFAMVDLAVADSQNEAELAAETDASDIEVGSYVRINGVRYEAVETTNGALLLVPEPSTEHLTTPNSASTPIRTV
jgi:hypothetical protein